MNGSRSRQIRPSESMNIKLMIFETAAWPENVHTKVGNDTNSLLIVNTAPYKSPYPSNSRMNKAFRLLPGIHGNEPHLRYGKTNKNTRLNAGVFYYAKRYYTLAAAATSAA